MLTFHRHEHDFAVETDAVTPHPGSNINRAPNLPRALCNKSSQFVTIPYVSSSFLHFQAISIHPSILKVLFSSPFLSLWPLEFAGETTIRALHCG